MHKTGWPPSMPDCLTDICLDYCVQNLDKTVCAPRTDECCRFCPRPTVCLPSQIGDAILKVIGYHLTRQHLGLMDEPEVVSFKQIDLRRIADLTDDELLSILKHKPSELRLSSERLTNQSVAYINTASDNLMTLFIDNCSGLFENSLNNDQDSGCVSFALNKSVVDPMNDTSEMKRPTNQRLLCPKLRWLAIREAKIVDADLCQSIFSRSFLMRLDLSDSQISLNDLHSGLQSLKSLQILSLHNVKLENLETAVDAISNVKSLR